MSAIAEQWLLLFRKEMLELSRTYKWIWVPCVFVLLGIMQPVTSYYMPQILETAGGLPEGAVIVIPPPTGAYVLTETLGNFGMIGLLVLVLAAMGAVSGERAAGAATLVLVRPVRFASYITAKWAAFALLAAASLALGIGASWYYTHLLIENVPLPAVLQSAVFYAMWLALVIAAVVFYSTVLKAPSAAAFLTLVSVAALSVLTSLLKGIMGWSPARLPAHAAAVLEGGRALDGLALNIAWCAALTIALLVGASFLLRRKQGG